MADYYHEARAAKKALKEVSDANKKRREERREQGLEDGGVEHPLNHLTVTGRGCRLHRNPEQYAALERQDGLIPWNGDAENLIDRFDARALLDFYRDPPANVQRSRTTQEEKLQELIKFETYRDLVRLMARGLSESKGLAAALQENLEIRAQRRGAAAAAYRVHSHQALPGDSAAAAGMGQYSAVGFQYDTGTAAGTADVSSSSSDDDSDDDEEQQGASAEEAAAEAEQDRVDAIADAFGVSDFTYRLHRAEQAEGGVDEAWRWKPRKRTGRKAARARARRMAGQGLDPKGAPLSRDWKDPLAMNAPSAYLIKPRRPSPERGHDRTSSRSRSRSRSPGRGAGVANLLASLPTARTTSIDRKAFESKEDDILEALPERDPAQEGAQTFPMDTALIAIKKQQEQRYRRSRSRSRDRHHRSRSRSRERRRWRDSHSSHRSRSRSRSGERGRSRERYSHSRDRDHDRDRHGRGRDHGRSQDRTAAAVRTSSGAGGKAGSSTAPNAETTKETPQERLKRIMAAQLNKQLSKDAAVATQKKIQAEKEKSARTQLQWRSRSSRDRSRSRSPEQYHDDYHYHR